MILLPSGNGQHSHCSALRKKTNAGHSELQTAFLRLDFEQNPIDGRADNALTMKLLPLEIIYNPLAIKSILEFLTPPASESATVSTIQVYLHALRNRMEGI